MKSIVKILEERFGDALKSVCGRAYPAMVRAAADARFGDYQVNGIMPAAKANKLKPRQLAEQVIAAADVSDLCLPPEIAGPGFVNLRLKEAFLAERLLKRLIRHRDEMLTFLHRAEVPFENNFGERSIRGAVIMRKNSYNNRSEKGASTQSALMSVFFYD